MRSKGAAKTANQQFGSWLEANTPNLAKKSVVRVTGYEEEIKEDAVTCRSPDRNDVDEGDKQVLSDSRVDSRMSVANSGAGDEQFDQVEGGGELITVDQPEQVMVSSSSQEWEGDGLELKDLCFPKGRTSEPTQVFLDQEFQAQLVDIDKELTKFDGKDKEGEESAVERPCTTNSKVLESTIYLNNLFTQTNPRRQPPLE